MPRGLQSWLATLALVVLALTPSVALAHGNMAAAGLGSFLILLIGVAFMFASMSLGALAWVTALRPPKSSVLVFGRGFIGFAAITTFLIGGVMVAAGLGKSLGSFGKYADTIVGYAAASFLIVEFFVAGTLYLRVHRERKSVASLLLCGASYFLAGVIGLFTLISLAYQILA